MSVRILGPARDGLAPPRVASTAHVESGVRVGTGSQVWHHSQIRVGAVIGEQCVLGRDVYIGPGVVIGDRCKIQNSAQVYEPARLATGVFVGPGAVLTNDLHPRAVTPAGRLKDAADWNSVGVTVGEGASIGARAVCVAPVHIGAWAMVAAGAVVVRDVPAYALVAGVPARQIGWVGPAGVRLVEEVGASGERLWICPDTGALFRELDGALVALPGPPTV